MTNIDNLIEAITNNNGLIPDTVHNGDILECIFELHSRVQVLEEREISVERLKEQ